MQRLNLQASAFICPLNTSAHPGWERCLPQSPTLPVWTTRLSLQPASAHYRVIRLHLQLLVRRHPLLLCGPVGSPLKAPCFPVLPLPARDSLPPSKSFATYEVYTLTHHKAIFSFSSGAPHHSGQREPNRTGPLQVAGDRNTFQISSRGKNIYIHT